MTECCHRINVHHKVCSKGHHTFIIIIEIYLEHIRTANSIGADEIE